MLDYESEVTRHLLVAHPMRNRKVEHFVWDGNADDGALAPDGIYTLRIHEIDRDRTITPPGEHIQLTRGVCPPE